jgi:hypothetical protein
MKKRIFVSFLMPYPIRNKEAPYLWIFYKQLSLFKSDEIVFIGDAYYRKDPVLLKDRDEITEASANYGEYNVPTIEHINQYTFCDVPSTSIFATLDRQNHSNTNQIFKSLLTQALPELVDFLDTNISELLKKYDIAGVLSWCNVPSLSLVALKYNIPIIHNELGALRSTNYLPMAYFDFSGVNGHTEAKTRFSDFKQEVANLPLLSMEALRDLVLNVDFPDSDKNTVDVGVALQVEDDSNTLAYSNGFDALSLIRWVNKKYSNQKIVLRQHPVAHFSYEKLGQMDESGSIFEFLSKCRTIVTINSSVALEALLFEKEVEILGDSPFRFILEINNPEEKRWALNFAVFAYMVPYDFLFDYDYYLWRVSKPSEADIFVKHLAFYQEKVKHREKKQFIANQFLSNFECIQLFIDNGQGYTEEASIRVAVDTTEELQSFTFDLSAYTDIRQLRLDPLNQACVIDIEKLVLVLNTGKEVDLLPHLAANLFYQNQQRYFFETIDPNLYFDNLDLSRLSLVSLRADIRYQHKGSEAVAATLQASLENKAHELLAQTQALQQITTDLTLAEQDKQALHLQSQTLQTALEVAEQEKLALHQQNQAFQADLALVEQEKQALSLTLQQIQATRWYRFFTTCPKFW